MFKFMLYNDSEIIFYDTETHIVFSLGYFLAKIQKNTRPYQYQMINPLTNCYPIESSMGPNEEAREQFLDWISQGKGYPRIFPNPTNTNLDFCFDEMKIFKDGEYHGINDANELWNLNATLSSQLYATICRGFSKVTEEFKEYSQIYFCHNSTAASTTNKTLQILSPESTNWIKYGSVVHVFNENTNTATNPKFYIQNQAIPIYYGGQPITTDNLDLAGKAGQILTYYIYSEEGDNNQTIYCAMYMGSSEKNILTAGTNITINNNTISATDTKNTAGSTDSSSKLYLIGAASQATNPQTYSDNEVFVKDGVLNAQELTIGSRKSGSTIGSNSVAEGVNTEASGNASHAEGNYTTASGTYSHAEGTSNTASGSGSHAEGTSTKAIGYYSHAEGYNTQATNDAAHAEGYSTQATHRGTHAEGYCSKATSIHSHAEGSYSVSMGDASHAEGYTIQYSSGTIGSIDKANLQLTVNGLPEHYGNYLKYVLSDKAYATGDYSIENSSRNNSSGAYTFTVSQWNSGFTVGAVVYIFGVSCTKGTGSHSEGLGTYAADVASHSEGKGTIATAQAQHVEGTWNIINSNLAHIVGNGTDNANRSNAYTLDWNGNGVYAGKLTVGTGPSNNMDVATKKYVDDSLLALPEPMIFKGSLGTGGTITTLPAASASNEGHTYKVITAGTYASQSAKIGDTFISDGSIWVLIPSGDEPSGTVTSVKIEATGPIAVNDNSAITTSGVRTISHSNSGVTAGTYRSVTVNDTGHITAGTNPTTISGYGITDAKIASGTITLGNNTITPLTSHQDISGKEDSSNKVTSLSSSSTNTQYPSAKLVYDQLALKQTLFATDLTSNLSFVDGTAPTLASGTYYAGDYTISINGSIKHQLDHSVFAFANYEDGSYSLIKLFGPGYPYVVAYYNWDLLSNTWEYYQGIYIDETRIDTTLPSSPGSTYNKRIPSTKLLYDQLALKTDTKNTAGSTDTSSKIYLVGATEQSANPQTYSQDTAYVGTDGKLYSNSKEVVNLSDTQALTNKTYNGYTLAAACAKAVVTSIDTSASLPTSGAVKTFVEGKGYVTIDTKNTAGSTDTSNKIYLVGATSQTASSQTYSDDEVYTTSGTLTAKEFSLGTNAKIVYNTNESCIEFNFS